MTDTLIFPEMASIRLVAIGSLAKFKIEMDAICFSLEVLTALLEILITTLRKIGILFFQKQIIFGLAFKRAKK